MIFVFLISINNLSYGLKCNAKLIAFDTSLFSVAKSKEECANDLTNELNVISNWAYNLKVSFNLEPKNPA